MLKHSMIVKRKPRGFTLLELLIVIVIVAMIGQGTPLGKFFMFMVMVLAAVLIEAAMGAKDRVQEHTKIIRAAINLLCALTALAVPALLPHLLGMFVTDDRVFQYTREIYVVQTLLIFGVGIGLRLIWTRLSVGEQEARKSFRFPAIAQAFTALAIVLPTVVFSKVTVITDLAFRNNTAFTENPAALIYYIDPDGHVRRIGLNGSAEKIVSYEKVSPEAILVFGEEPDFKMQVYERARTLDQNTSHTLTCSDCRFTSETVAAYLRPVSFREQPWRNVFRQRGMHGDAWWPVNFDQDARYHVMVRLRYHMSNDESLAFEDRGPHMGKRIYLRAQFPTAEWAWRYVYILPGGEVVAQFGDSIVLLDLDTRQIGFLAKGSRPVVTSL